ncbi:sensor histidine kinase [Kitasatospora sp. NPDC059571]|uniref:sensor histidine kinase n=1 Tax=Kitasatospora sp. NPDC059571 TaxID=3346871 RepID=UPI0036A53499
MTSSEQTLPARSARPGARTGFAALPALLGQLRVRVLTERYPTAVDFCCALALLLLTAVPQHRELHARPWFWLLQAALVLPLTFRRRAPFAVFGVTAAVAFVQWLTAHAMPADLAVLLALYTVAAHCPRRRTAVAYAVVELGALLSVLRWTPTGEHGSLLDNQIRIFVLLSGTTAAALVIGLNVRARRAQLAALRQRAVDLERSRDQQSALAVAQERSRIAREMHDIVTHNLSVMVALADAAVYANPRSPERATEAMRQSAETGRRALTDMRRFLGVLRADEPDALRHPQPGIGQLAALVDQVRAAGLPAGLALTGDHSGISPGAQLTVYRLVQESLTNTLKHAAPGVRAEVRVDCSPAAVAVEVSDDGRPFAAVPGLGQGLAGMRERAAAYGGDLTAGPLPGGGWRVAVTLDLDDPEEADAG